ncbi:PKD domain-containing protein [Halocola ammonii]
MNKGDEKIREVFQDAFENFEAPVKPSAWTGIESGMNAGASGGAAGGSSITSWISSNVAWVAGGVIGVSAAVVIAVSTIGDSPKTVDKPVASEQTEQVQEETNASEKAAKEESAVNEEEINSSAISKVEEQIDSDSQNQTATNQDDVAKQIAPTSENSEVKSTNEKAIEQSANQPVVHEETGNSVASTTRDQEGSPSNEDASVEGEDSKGQQESTDQTTATPLKSTFAVNVSDESPLKVSLQANDASADQYIWNFGDGKTEVTSAPIANHTYASEGNYTVKLRVRRGESEKESTKQVEVFGRPKLVLPNVFSPNGDGKNEYYSIDFKESKNIESYTVRVFTLDGEQIFQSHADQTDWGGEMPNGAPAPEGKYVVVVKAIATNGDPLTTQQKVITLTR